MKYIKNKIIQLTFGLCVILSTISFTFGDDNTKPIIQTNNTPTSSSVFVKFPASFSGKVFTTCINGTCNSTTSPITEKEIKEIENRFEEQRKTIELFFRQQEEFFNQLFKGFDIFTNFQENIKPNVQGEIKLTA